MTVLITGGLGFIGSHICVELLMIGHKVIILDDLSNSNIEVLYKIEQITHNKVNLYIDDCKNKKALNKIFKNNKIDVVIHCAGFKAVGESVKDPLKYYENNLESTISLLQIMCKYNVKKLIFSSTATVYGVPDKCPIDETFKVGNTTNPYATTKYMIEEILKDLYNINKDWSIVILRYFNPIGAHKSGLIGENPNGTPNNLMPYILKVASGELPCLNIFGNDYNTYDGTGIRDYIHVVDLAKAHLKALNKIDMNNNLSIYNIGTGRGYSVLDVIDTFERVNLIRINYKTVDRRPGDIDEYYSNPTKAERELDWKAELDLEEMCKDSWKFYKKEKHL